MGQASRLAQQQLRVLEQSQLKQLCTKPLSTSPSQAGGEQSDGETGRCHLHVGRGDGSAHAANLHPVQCAARLA